MAMIRKEEKVNKKKRQSYS